MKGEGPFLNLVSPTGINLVSPTGSLRHGFTAGSVLCRVISGNRQRGLKRVKSEGEKEHLRLCY